jgi:CheY-like chemotaxis protein
MKIMVLEANQQEQEHIAQLLGDTGAEILYTTTVPRAINSLGILHVDLALIDADQADKKNKICDWKDLIDFLKKIKVEYTVFSSNGKVGIKDGQEIISINELHKAVPSLPALEEVESL